MATQVSLPLNVEYSLSVPGEKRLILTLARPLREPLFLASFAISALPIEDAPTAGTVVPGTPDNGGSAEVRVAEDMLAHFVHLMQSSLGPWAIQFVYDTEFLFVLDVEITQRERRDSAAAEPGPSYDVPAAQSLPSAEAPSAAPPVPVSSFESDYEGDAPLPSAAPPERYVSRSRATPAASAASPPLPTAAKARLPVAPVGRPRVASSTPPASPPTTAVFSARPPTEGRGEAPDVHCHFYAEMAARPTLAHPTELRVTLTLELLEKLAGPTTQFASARIRDKEPITVIARPRNNCRIVGVDSDSVPPPRARQPEELVFAVQGLREGPAELLVIARQGARTLVSLVLQPQFVADIAPLNVGAAVSMSANEPPLVELRIYEDRAGSQFRLRFVLECRDLALNMNHVSAELRSDRNEYVEGLYQRLEDSWHHERGDFKRFIARIRDLGGELYNELVPLEIRKVLWQHRDVLGAIEVVSQEPFIPWEIAHLVEPDKQVEVGKTRFLGELGLVRWMDNLAWPPAQLSVARDRAWFVVPDYPHPDWQLPALAHERDFLSQKFGASSAPVESLDLLDFIRDGSKVDLLHFACHGIASGNTIWNAGLMLQGAMRGDEYQPDTLEVSQIKQNANFWERVDRNRPIVFLNACQVGRQGYTLTGVGGLAEAFLRRGAGLLIATLWSVGDAPALTFSREFYERLAAGDTVTRAVRHARAASKSGHEATFLAYCVYGHAYARLKIHDGTV